MAPGSHDGYVVIRCVECAGFTVATGSSSVEVQILTETVSKLLYST